MYPGSRASTPAGGRLRGAVVRGRGRESDEARRGGRAGDTNFHLFPFTMRSLARSGACFSRFSAWTSARLLGLDARAISRRGRWLRPAFRGRSGGGRGRSACRAPGWPPRTGPTRPSARAVLGLETLEAELAGDGLVGRGTRGRRARASRGPARRLPLSSYSENQRRIVPSGSAWPAASDRKSQSIAFGPRPRSR